MRPSFPPMRASAPRAAPKPQRNSATAFSRFWSRRRRCCWSLRCVFMPQVIDLLAPGFSREPRQFALAVSLTRITFPYLLLITLVTLWGGMLNALHRFAVAAAAPILLNVAMMATLALAVYFPGPGYAAAWGVLISGVLQALLVGGDVIRSGVMTWFRALRFDDNVRRFFKALIPGDHRLGRHAARAVRRHHHSELPVDGRHLGAVLRRPHRSTADRRHRYRGGHGAAAGDDAAARVRRRLRRTLGAEPSDRICAPAGHSLRGGLPDHARHHHARSVHARPFQRRRRRTRRRRR